MLRKYLFRQARFGPDTEEPSQTCVFARIPPLFLDPFSTEVCTLQVFLISVIFISFSASVPKTRGSALVWLQGAENYV